jgi:SAM-dependent methyltransferase
MSQNNKIFRTDLFKHLDGIALIPALSNITKSSFVGLNKLAQGKNFNLSLEDIKKCAINGDYINMTLRLFESQGWLVRELTHNDIKVTITSLGKKHFSEIDIYISFFSYYNYLSSLSFDDDTHLKIEPIFRKFNNLTTSNALIIKHIEGLLIGPIIVSLSINKYFSMENNKIIFKNKLNQKNIDFLYKFFEKFGFIDKNNKLTEKGLFFLNRSAAYGVTTSYMPLFSKIDILLFNDTSNLLERDDSGNEQHVNRVMNVWGSGGAHKVYFKKIDEIVTEIFNYPLDKQPKGIADMGCGDGTMLIHLYKLIKNNTLRGDNLKEFPLEVIGADFNKEALDVTHLNLNRTNIKHTLIEADIGDPESFNEKLFKTSNIKLNELLNVRSFLDHNRNFIEPSVSIAQNNNITTNSTAAFCTKTSNEILPPITFKLSLIEHFMRWKPFINKFGLIVLELHTINPTLCSKNIGKTVATAYDATHGYSNQYIIEYEDFLDSAIIAGLKNNDKFEFKFPNKELTTVSINLLSAS